MKRYLNRIWTNCGRFLGIVLLLLPFVGSAHANAEELNIYSHRQAFLINPFLDAFTAKTGIKTSNFQLDIILHDPEGSRSKVPALP